MKRFAVPARRQVERRLVESREAIDAAICDRDPKAMSLEPRTSCEAGMQVILDNQNAAHH
jgi:hypothetical protein